MKRVPFKGMFGAILAAAALIACHREPSPPVPQSRQQEAAEAESKAASIEAEMNKDAQSESIARKPDDASSQPPPPKESPPPQ
jgi:hypothetical protein